MGQALSLKKGGRKVHSDPGVSGRHRLRVLQNLPEKKDDMEKSKSFALSITSYHKQADVSYYTHL